MAATPQERNARAFEKYKLRLNGDDIKPAVIVEILSDLDFAHDDISFGDLFTNHSRYMNPRWDGPENEDTERMSVFRKLFSIPSFLVANADWANVYSMPDIFTREYILQLADFAEKNGVSVYNTFRGIIMHVSWNCPYLKNTHNGFTNTIKYFIEPFNESINEPFNESIKSGDKKSLAELNMILKQCAFIFTDCKDDLDALHKYLTTADLTSIFRKHFFSVFNLASNYNPGPLARAIFLLDAYNRRETGDLCDIKDYESVVDSCILSLRLHGQRYETSPEFKRKVISDMISDRDLHAVYKSYNIPNYDDHRFEAVVTDLNKRLADFPNVLSAAKEILEDARNYYRVGPCFDLYRKYDDTISWCRSTSPVKRHSVDNNKILKKNFKLN